MTVHTTVSPAEAADRLAIRDWFFAGRRLMVDWTETRPSTP